MGIATNIVLEHAHRDAEGQRAWSALGTAEPTEEEEEQLELQNNVKKALFQGDATLQRAATSKEKLAWLTVPKSEGSSTDGVPSSTHALSSTFRFPPLLTRPARIEPLLLLSVYRIVQAVLCDFLSRLTPCLDSC
jgi:hypothetical protein